MFLMENGADPATGLGVGINLITGIASAVVIGRKGHSTYQVLVHLLFGVFCCGIGSLISALVAEDLATKRRLEELEFRNQSMPRPQPHPMGGGTGQVRCDRCGSMNAAELVSCWHCGKELVEPRGMVPAGRGILPSKDVQMPKREVVAESPKPAPKLRVACRACGKRFAGDKGKIQTLKKCPKCGHSPFDYRLLSRNSDT